MSDVNNNDFEYQDELIKRVRSSIFVARSRHGIVPACRSVSR